MAIQEEDGADGLVLGGGGNMPFDYEMGDELVDLVDAHFFGVAFVVVEDVFSDPLDVGFAGARGVLFELDGVVVLVEEFFFGFFWICLGLVFVHFQFPFQQEWRIISLSVQSILYRTIRHNTPQGDKKPNYSVNT